MDICIYLVILHCSINKGDSKRIIMMEELLINNYHAFFASIINHNLSVDKALIAFGIRSNNLEIKKDHVVCKQHDPVGKLISRLV